MANAKIISFVDAEVAAVMRLTAKDLDAARAQATQDTAFVAANLRHDIAVLTDRVSNMRLQLTNAIADNTLTLRRDINAIAAAVNQLRQDVEALKQGGEGSA